MRQVAALFVRADSVYKSMPGVDCYDIERDARTWPGGMPGVFHPPCRAWGVLRRWAKPRKGERHLATWSVRMVRQHGGVLEHPAGSRLWPRCGLPRPGAGMDRHGGWTLGITQHWWGHRATKATLLYIVGVHPAQIPELPSLRLGEGERVITATRRAKTRPGHPAHRTECTKAEREHTPPALAEWLVELSRFFDERGGGICNYRPILRWSAADVFEAHAIAGLQPNPLYRQGMSRVGCMPCINAGKDEVLAISRRFPGHIERVALWEVAVARASKRVEASFFPDHDDQRHLQMRGIQNVVQWAKTARGGRQFDWLRVHEEAPACESAYGLCE